MGRFELQIRETLGTASVVVAFWSPGATASYCERAELRVARRLGRLVNLRAPEFPVDEVPLHFRENQVLLLDLGYMGPILKTLRMVWEPDLSSGQETLLSGDKHMIDVCRGLHTAYQAAMDELTAVLGKARAVEIATGDTA